MSNVSAWKYLIMHEKGNKHIVKNTFNVAVMKFENFVFSNDMYVSFQLLGIKIKFAVNNKQMFNWKCSKRIKPTGWRLHH